MKFIISVLALFAQQLFNTGNVQPHGIASFLSHGFEQTKITDCVAAARPVVWHNTQLSYTSDGLALAGSDVLGEPWKAVVPASGVKKCEVWSAQLRGREDDLIVIDYGMNSSGYDSELTILFFGQDGRPIPWQAVGGFDSTDSGVTQIVHLATMGTAGIVVPTRAGDRWDGYAYVQNLYDVTGSNVSKVIGSMAGVTWPAVTGNTKLLSGTESHQTMSLQFDLLATLRGRAGPAISKIATPATASANPQPLADIARVAATPPTEPEGAMLQLSDGTKLRMPYIVVADSVSAGRTIFFDQYVPEGVDRLMKSEYSTHAIGQMYEEELCRPFILWGSTK